MIFFLFAACTTSPPENPIQSTWYQNGKKVYEDKCARCHKIDGSGIAGVFPPLKGAQWIEREPELIASIITRGLGGEISVAGETYRSAMPPQELTAQQTFDVIAYIRFAFAQKIPVRVRYLPHIWLFFI